MCRAYRILGIILAWVCSHGGARAQEQVSLGVFSRRGQKSKREILHIQVLLRSGLQKGIPSMMPHSLAQSESQGQLRLEGRVIDYLLIERTAKSYYKMVWIQRGWRTLAIFVVSLPPFFCGSLIASTKIKAS